VRVDVLLHRLRLTRSRSEAKSACEVGAIRVDGVLAKPAQGVAAGSRLEVRYPQRTLVVSVTELPPKSLSKKAARDYYDVVEDRDTGSLP
jgi:ribosomal 50S subunit-recycling heat shock protein